MPDPAPRPDTGSRPDAGRRSFGPVVLLGLAGGTLAAVGGTRAWATADSTSQAGQVVGYSLSDAGEMPAATAAALVVLACWGVVLVTRGRVRRAVAVLGAVAALGVLAAVVVGWSSTVEDLRAAYASSGAGAETSRTGWFWASALGAVAAVVAGALGVRLVPRWPEMGSRYDAPAAGSTPDDVDDAAQRRTETAEASNLDLWRAIDEGRDPTA